MSSNTYFSRSIRLIVVCGHCRCSHHCCICLLLAICCSCPCLLLVPCWATVVEFWWQWGTSTMMTKKQHSFCCQLLLLLLLRQGSTSSSRGQLSWQNGQKRMVGQYQNIGMHCSPISQVRWCRQHWLVDHIADFLSFNSAAATSIWLMWLCPPLCPCCLALALNLIVTSSLQVLIHKLLVYW